VDIFGHSFLPFLLVSSFLLACSFTHFVECTCIHVSTSHLYTSLLISVRHSKSLCDTSELNRFPFFFH
jgi:hypothetical protein